MTFLGPDERDVSLESTKPLEEYIDQFFKENFFPSTTRHTYRYHFRTLIHSVGKTEKTFTESEIRKYSDRVRILKQERSISLSTARGAIFSARSFLKWFCLREGPFKETSIQRIETILEPPKGTPPDKVDETQILTPYEVRKMIDACPSEKKRALIKTLAGSGLRVDEIRRLTPTDVKLRQYEDHEEYLLKIRQSKNNKSREVPVTSNIVEALDSYLELWDRSFTDEDDDCPIFWTRENTMASKQTINNWIDEIRQRTELSRNITCHTFRHSYATQLLREGVSIQVVSERLGHSDFSTTINAYYHHREETESPEYDWWTEQRLNLTKEHPPALEQDELLLQ